MMSGFTAAGFFLISILFGLMIYSLWIRIALRYLRISYLNPLSQLIHSVTDPVIKPFHFILKKPLQPKQRYDWMAFGALIIIELLKIISISLLAFHAVIPVVFLLIYLLADLIIQPCNLLFYAILIRVVMSYTNPGWRHPVAEFLFLLTQPLLILGRRIVPDISGFDFSPFIMMIILKLITLFISHSLPWNLL